jgi:hypothetical protein
LLPQPNSHDTVAGLQQLHLGPPHRDPALGSAAAHNLGELGLLPTGFNGARRDAKPGGNFLVGTLQRAEFLQFDEIDLGGLSACPGACSARPHSVLLHSLSGYENLGNHEIKDRVYFLDRIFNPGKLSWLHHDAFGGYQISERFA